MTVRTHGHFIVLSHWDANSLHLGVVSVCRRCNVAVWVEVWVWVWGNVGVGEMVLVLVYNDTLVK